MACPQNGTAVLKGLTRSGLHATSAAGTVGKTLEITAISYIGAYQAR